MRSVRLDRRGMPGTQTMAVSVRALADERTDPLPTPSRLSAGIPHRPCSTARRSPCGSGSEPGPGLRNPVTRRRIAVAMLINIVIAGFAGHIRAKVVLDRLDQDPALASSVFVRMITDTMGFLASSAFAVAGGIGQASTARIGRDQMRRFTIYPFPLATSPSISNDANQKAGRFSPAAGKWLAISISRPGVVCETRATDLKRLLPGGSHRLYQSSEISASPPACPPSRSDRWSRHIT